VVFVVKNIILNSNHEGPGGLHEAKPKFTKLMQDKNPGLFPYLLNLRVFTFVFFVIKGVYSYWPFDKVQ
jgi:hypothetical protein